MSNQHPILPAALIMFFLACSGSEAPPETTTDGEAPPADVVLRTATLETIPRLVRAHGALEPWRRVSPGTKILGRVARVAVREGDRVAAGALLARLESRDLEAAVQQAEAAVRVAEARLDNTRAQRDRMIGLHDRGSVTDKSFEDATAGYQVAKASLAQTAANLTAAKVTLGYAEIRSPLDGWVVTRRVEAGDMARPGAPLFTLEDLTRVKVHVQVPEADVVGLASGAQARVEVLDRELLATIDRIVPAGDPATRTFSVKLVLDNPDGTLKSGMFARASFVRGERQALRVETPALVARGQLEGLYMAGDDGRIHLRWVKTGPVAGGRTEILSGLEAGERYLAAPPTGLVDGARYLEAGR